MKKFLLFIAMVLSQLAVVAKDYAPTTNWPYILPDFQQGIIYHINGTESNALMNIHLHNNALQCVNPSGQIIRIIAFEGDKIVFKDSEYHYLNGMLLEKLYSVKDMYLFNYEEADFEKMLGLFLPYTVDCSTNSSIDVRGLDLKGEQNEKYSDVRAVWYDGKEIPLTYSKYFYIKGKLIPAKYNSCKEILSSQQRKELKKYISANNLTWTGSDLKKILAYLSENL